VITPRARPQPALGQGFPPFCPFRVPRSTAVPGGGSYEQAVPNDHF